MPRESYFRNSKQRVCFFWIAVTVLFVFISCVYVFDVRRLTLQASQILTVFVAIFAAMLGSTLPGAMNLTLKLGKKNSTKIEASSGFAVLIFVLLWWKSDLTPVQDPEPVVKVRHIFSHQLKLAPGATPTTTELSSQKVITNLFAYLRTNDSGLSNPPSTNSTQNRSNQASKAELSDKSGKQSIPGILIPGNRHGPLQTNPVVPGRATSGPPSVLAATNAVISISPLELTFGSVYNGASATNTFAVANVGGGILSGAASVPPPFAIISGENYALGPGQSQSVAVAFRPSDGGATSRQVSFTGGGGANAKVSGTGGIPPVTGLHLVSP